MVSLPETIKRNGGPTMKKLVIILVTLTLIHAIFSLDGWAQSSTSVRTSTWTNQDELSLLDLLIARPLGIVAGIAGTGVFIATLPFTVPTKSTARASKMLISAPFHFSFSRQFPDQDLTFE
jgi:hypothetical protein